MSNPHRVGLLASLLLGGCHLVWSALVAAGVGQIIYDFILWAHMIHVAIKVGPFDPLASVTLVAGTAILGYAGGYLGSLAARRIR